VIGGYFSGPVGEVENSSSRPCIAAMSFKTRVSVHQQQVLALMLRQRGFGRGRQTRLGHLVARQGLGVLIERPQGTEKKIAYRNATCPGGPGVIQ